MRYNPEAMATEKRRLMHLRKFKLVDGRAYSSLAWNILLIGSNWDLIIHQLLTLVLYNTNVIIEQYSNFVQIP